MKYLILLMSLCGANAMAMSASCGSLNNSPSAAGYDVEIQETGSGYVATVSHTNSSGKDTFVPETFDVQLTYGAGKRLTKIEGTNFQMDFSSPWGSATDITRGNYTMSVTLSTGRKISLKSDSDAVMCAIK